MQFGLSLIWTEARERGYSIADVSQWMATRPAQFAGLGNRKGKIAAGFDADLIVFDDDGQYLITADIIKYRHKITPYEGRTVKGVVRSTYVRGTKIYADGNLLGDPIGKPLLKHKL